ncbi:hypothetical protein CesoFtcFv8_021034 [Champsocephalus esox]|uniref:Peroxiredoxin-like 2A n=1 Tax=Champsocephalus esox TaxID=159716 RepID=A0AAN8BC07_9TELE|nr:hypothetical protein CesoFtcFv8_021034 [Champsocephalus esox]
MSAGESQDLCSNFGGLWSECRVMVSVATVLKAVSLFVAELISSVTDFPLGASMSDTGPNLCGRRLELWSWLYGDPDDYCAERKLLSFYVDLQRNFYGPHQRSMFLSMFLRVGVWMNIWRAYRRGFRGNIRGEGHILGGVFVIGPGDQGILLEHREKEFGDKVNLLAVLTTARKMQDDLAR